VTVDSIIHRAVKSHRILSYPNVVGYSNQLMPRIRRGVVIPEEQCIRIYVQRKVPEAQLKPSEIIPKKITLEDGREVCTDVVEIGRLRKLQLLDPKKRWRPSPTGVSTSRADIAATGTIGWFVVDEDGEVYIMSNNHVWANENRSARGDLLIQPGQVDGGDPERDVLFTLYDFVPIDFAGGLNTVDVAIATINDLSNVYMSILNVGGVTGKRVPGVGESVSKMGRTTGLTSGTVIDSSATVQVAYESGLAVFTDVIIVQGERVVGAGDSGSPVLTAGNEFVGLVFAGNDNGSTMVACKYTNIERALSDRLGKKLHVLVANSYPPFFVKERFKWCIRLLCKIYL
jgi:Trypsin.